jgi:hypothetical protein
MIEVLRAISQNARIETVDIDDQRIRVGESIIEWKILQLPNGTIKRKKPEARELWAIRSRERPELILVGVNKKFFTTKGNKPIKWIKDAERFLMRAFGVAVLAHEIIERGEEWPTAHMGETVKAAIETFRKKSGVLKNMSTKAIWENLGANNKNARNRTQLTTRQEVTIRNRPKYVELAIANSQVPVAGAHGLSLFEYVPMQGAPAANQANQKAWFIKEMARATGGLEPGGITMPLWRFRNLDPKALPMPDTLFDETTLVRVQTRFEVVAVCVVRLHYYRVPDRVPGGAGVTTQQVLDHERQHFRGIRDAWASRTRALQTALGQLANDMNQQLGLAGEEAFQFRADDIRDVWVPDNENPHLTSIPVGPVDQFKEVRKLHSFPEVSVLRIRIVREFGDEHAEEPLIKILKDDKDLDPKFVAAKEIFDQWMKDHWHEYRNRFVRDFLLAALELDSHEGIMRDGEQTGRPELVRVRRKLAEMTDPRDPKKARKDPLKVLQKLYKRYNVRD